jgi:rare lipoprotein A
MFMRAQSVGVCMAAMILLGGCAETQLVFHTAKTIGSPAQKAPQPRYKVGDPYPIKGVYYYPAVNYRYEETGIASWYGKKFHGRATANGEIYDMNQLTAAHRTLPLPSIVRVINLENGRAIRVRVNDRGPFARGRIIDLSRRAAQLLGFRYKGTARVRVEILADESRDVAARMAGPKIQNAGLVTNAAPAPGRVTAQPIDPPGAVRIQNNRRGAAPRLRLPVAKAPVLRPPRARQTRARKHQSVKVTDIFIQAGAFIRFSNADRARIKLGRHGRAAVVKTRVGRESFYRVRLGPIRSIGAADRMLAQVFASGYPKARIVIE